jgi:hypothetical protein
MAAFAAVDVTQDTCSAGTRIGDDMTGVEWATDFLSVTFAANRRWNAFPLAEFFG